MSTMDLPWFYDGRALVARTLYGELRIVGRTFPPVHMQLTTRLTGFTIYFKGARIGWTIEERDAIQVASQAATGAMIAYTQGRLA